MEITYQSVLDKNNAKAARKISREIYKHNKNRKMMRLGDFLLYLFFFLPSIFLAFELMDWGEYLYDCYENILANYAGHILLLISVCCFFYAIFLRPYLNTKAFQSQVFEGANKSTTVQIQENGLCTKIDSGQVLHNYRYIHHIENHYGYLTIRIGGGQFLSIPYSAFQDDAHREAFEAALREKIKAYQAEPLSK
ncbi:hypothetical protein JP0009_20950 [Helicobacter pylori]